MLSSVAKGFESSRLSFRPFRQTDAAEAHWFQDPEVMRFMPFPPDECAEQTLDRIDGYIDHQNRHGFSKWLVSDRVSGRPIGDAGIMFLPGRDEIELGYRLIRPCWNQGLATEAAIAWCEHTFHFLGMTRLVAFASPAHKASLRVMEKAGFRFCRYDRLFGMEAVVYEARAVK
jgi:RimJ/RimL family protein N-acetyltransferase